MRLIRDSIIPCSLVLVFGMAACEPPRTGNHGPGYGPESNEEDFDPSLALADDEVDFDRILPAYALPDELRTGNKADSYDNYRAQNPQWYAQTIAPTGNFNYRAMKEWEPMQRLYITYTSGMMYDAPVANTLADIVVNTVKYAKTKVGVIYSSSSAKTDLTNRLKSRGLTSTQISSNVTFVSIAHNSIWHIDYGPVPLVRSDNAIAFADFEYYHQRTLDDAIPTRLGWYHNVNTFRMPVATEGGNFQGDGEGTCYISQRGLQYAGMTSAQMAKEWADYLGCTQQLVVLKDITDDGTGHIDMFFKLATKNKAIVGEYKSPYVSDSVNKQRMDDNAALLAATTVAGGSKITVYRMPFPSKVSGVPRTYLNSTFVNNVNLWPVYSDNKTAEAEALQVWKAVLPTYTHVGILSDKIAQYSGTIHCVSRTIPQGTLTPWIANGTCGTSGKCSATSLGYVGTCNTAIPCKGPAWECSCPDCSQCGTTSTATCQGFCGGQSSAGCYCDSLCSQYGDCCSDYTSWCQ